MLLRRVVTTSRHINLPLALSLPQVYMARMMQYPQVGRDCRARVGQHQPSGGKVKLTKLLLPSSAPHSKNLKPSCLCSSSPCYEVPGACTALLTLLSCSSLGSFRVLACASMQKYLGTSSFQLQALRNAKAKSVQCSAPLPPLLCAWEVPF